MLLCLLFCLLESEIFVFKAPDIIYSTLWRQSHQHPGCPDPFIRFLLVLYHKPTTFSKCKTKMREHNQTASKWAFAFPNPTQTPWPLWGSTDSLFTRGWLCYLCAVSHSIFLPPTAASDLGFCTSLHWKSRIWPAGFIMLVLRASLSPSAQGNDINPAALQGSHCTTEEKL